MARGMVSKGISRSVPCSSPYRVKVMPARWNSRSASRRRCASTSDGVSESHAEKAR